MGNILQERDNLLNEYVYKINNLKVYQYGKAVKMIYFKKPIRAKGFENSKPLAPEPVYIPETVEEMLKYAETITANANEKEPEKLKNNVRRAKNRVYELTMCNSWDYFGTFTINGEKWKRDDLHEFYKAFAKWLNNYNTRNGIKIQYLIIPELHKDEKNWHMHGLIRGLPPSHLSAFENGLHPLRLVQSNYLNWKAYEKKFGFCSFGEIQSAERVAAYVTKYVTKQLTDSKIQMGKHLYYASKGLEGKKIIYDGEFYPTEDESWDFENDFVCIKTIQGE